LFGDEQTLLDECGQNPGNPLVVVASSSARVTLRRVKASASPPATSLSRMLRATFPLVLGERPEGRLRMAADRALNPTQACVGGERERIVVALTPEIEQRGREQWKSTVSPATSSTSVSTSVGSTKRPVRADGPSIARRSSLALMGPSRTLFLSDEIGELDVGSEAREEVRPEGEQDHCAPLWVPRLVDQHTDERAPLVFGDVAGEQLLELVDREHEAMPCRLLRDRLRQLGRRPLARSDDHRPRAGAPAGRRLGAATTCRCPTADDREQRCVCEPRYQLVDEPLASEEDAGVAGFERLEPLERANAFQGLPRVPVTVTHVQRRVLHEDRSLDALELYARLEAELVDQELPRPAIDIEALGLSSAPVQREHELRTEALAVRMLENKRLQLGDEPELPAERELGVDARLYGLQPQRPRAVPRRRA
jgi:hypothetical protein